MKKLSTYFVAAIFFVTLYPKQCDWPNPNEETKVSVIEQQPIQTTIDTIDFNKS